MYETQFDTLVRTVARRAGRRDAIRALVGAGLGMAFTSAGWDRTRGLLTGPPAAGAAEQQAGSCYPPFDASGSLPDDGRFAETLVATSSGKLSRIQLEVVKLPEAKNGFVLLPRRWVVERSLGWMARFRRLARDYERLPETLAGLHFLAFAMLMLKRFITLMLESA